MKARRFSLAVASILLFLSSRGYCIDRGQTELSIDASLNVSNEGEVSHTYAVVNPRIGYFIFENFELGVGGNLLINSDFDAAGYGFAAKHFPMDDELGSALWFIGGKLGGEFGQEENGIILGVFGGVKLLVPQGGGALFVQPFFTRTLRDSHDFSEYGFSTGVSLFF